MKPLYEFSAKIKVKGTIKEVIFYAVPEAVEAQFEALQGTYNVDTVFVKGHFKEWHEVDESLFHKLTRGEF